VDDIKITRLGRRIMLQEWKMRAFQKRFLMEHFITPDQWENQEQDGRTSSRGTDHRS